ncbi:MAG: ATP-binding cassette domain-containing protein [Deltaproteobacteria bacterium]|nr:ATP-binding cassette domain-containing protein [Deltaproteobacteria bacterium]
MGKLLTLQEIYKHFPISSGKWLTRNVRMLKAVDGVSFAVEKGASFALAGESGSGKTTVARMILKLEKPTGGSMEFEGRDIVKFTRQEELWYRTRVQSVFQDASGSLNPRMRIGEIVGEPLEIQRQAKGNTLSNAEIRERAEQMLRHVGLQPRVMHNYPHELSGGQKQRATIARAMVLNPSLVVLDEPVSALDVSIRAQILNLLADIQDELGLTYFIIAHDLAMLGHVSSHIGVMYLGRIVEIGRTEEVYSHPQHPYTKALFAAMPLPDPLRTKASASVRGEIGSAMNLPMGCRFHPRCDFAQPRCREEEPALVAIGPDQSVACHLIGG